MANVENDYFSDVLDTLNKYQDRHGKRLSSKKLREAVGRVMNEEVEEMERNKFAALLRLDRKSVV